MEKEIESIKNKIPYIPTEVETHTYYGNKFNFAKHSYGFVEYMQLSQFTDYSVQGSAVYGDYLFTVCDTSAYIAVHNMKTKQYIGKM